MDRYAGYNKAPCASQNCYTHLFWEVEDLCKEVPDSIEVRAFVHTLIPLLSLAMGLRSQLLSQKQLQMKAAEVKAHILAVT